MDTEMDTETVTDLTGTLEERKISEYQTYNEDGEKEPASELRLSFTLNAYQQGDRGGSFRFGRLEVAVDVTSTLAFLKIGDKVSFQVNPL